MPRKLDNLNHFLFSSDFPTDKVIWLYEGSRTTPSTDTFDNFYIVNSSDLPYKDPLIFVKGACTVDDWETVIPIGTNYSIAGKNASMNISWYSMSPKGIYAQCDFRSFKNKTLKYRLWGVQREDIDFAVDYGPTASISKTSFQFDSSKNYPRLYKDGVAKSGDTITHGLGYIPYVDYWCNLSSDKDSLLSYWSYQPKGCFSSSGMGSWPSIQATKDTITFKKQYVNGSEQQDVVYYYRIYA